MLKIFKKYWIKYKWYFITGLFIILAIVLFLFGLKGDEYKKLTKWLFQKRVDLLGEAVEHRKEDIDKSDKEVEKIDKQLDELKNKKKAKKEEIDKMSLKEVGDEFKKLGY